jgi:hypothetical protein
LPLSYRCADGTAGSLQAEAGDSMTCCWPSWPRWVLPARKRTVTLEQTLVATRRAALLPMRARVANDDLAGDLRRRWYPGFPTGRAGHAGSVAALPRVVPVWSVAVSRDLLGR